MKYLIAVIGTAASYNGNPGQTALALAHETGKLIAERGAVLITGGRNGVMEAASRGASEAGGITVGILPGLDKTDANPYVDIVLPTGFGNARNTFTMRAADVAIMVGGGAGTLNELTISINERLTPVIVLEGSGGWADRIRAIAYDGKFLDERRLYLILFASSPQDAVEQAMQICIQKYST
jgi:uncharacterized protein (TIGR00725 family)